MVRRRSAAPIIWSPQTEQTHRKWYERPYYEPEKLQYAQAWFRSLYRVVEKSIGRFNSQESKFNILGNMTCVGSA